MRQLLNGKHPMNLGEPCTVPAAMYTNLVDFVQESTKTIDLMDPGETEYGWVTPLNDGDRHKFGLPKDLHAVVYWWNGDDRDPEHELRELNKTDADMITSQCEHVLVGAVCRHYEENGGKDDGHPAYAIYSLYRARRAQNERDTAKANQHAHA